jgi:putative addiction module component (TIGR02574 family)
MNEDDRKPDRIDSNPHRRSELPRGMAASDDFEDAPLTQAQQEELERRLRDMEENPDDYLTWDEVLRQLRESK